MDCSGLSLLVVTILTGVSCEQLTAVKNEESSLEGTSVTLSYSYSKISPGDYFFWYRQDPGEPPEFLISHTGTGQELMGLVSGLNFTVSDDKRHLNLLISSAAATDSAVYYCAVNAGQKMFFGTGTQLTVEPKEERNPEYYILGNKDSPTKVCLATEFTRHNATGNHLFNDTEPARNPKDHRFFSQVAFLKGGEERQCKEPEEVPICEASLEPDMMVNLASLSISILRLIFIKTVVFNVLMTLRLWISQ
uniref:Ig-like domain-containing protein n=2 Tax=Iconisemion striatum TaxID=60296 RepID=A0A1A7X9K7_9TELE